MTDLLMALVELTRSLGQPQLDYAVVGEGNTSCRIDADTFWIKASGQQMYNIGEDGFVSVKFSPILSMLEMPPVELSEQKAVMKGAMVNPNSPLLPSVEVSFHAMLLTACDVAYIGHTHPTSVNRVMCSSRAREFAANRLFPDEVVLCGPESVFMPYIDPGLPLAIALRDEVRHYLDNFGESPKVILLANHGMIALGQSASEILNVTAMCVKAASIFAGVCSIGEPIFMSRDDIYHIHKRPDEIYRRRQFVESHR